ncbi:SusC/RagA family TonB-linked outer membrane protein [Echinicola vietnamensis]|uniref:TonB-linked outer membrane protein, SusC/RagA family n=1 Tax=Echinicola vietnamensis (strain DSM 17526 / LMG 23754 / KMM 6221) TaxID=926556 RepID=L0G3X8_ECHVK|nr:TonB-dependent receptor [Echinicola vietnamensis]AGA79716.1 TonB-linked outer membrane protein, SusC/RagA family [Echinicola vietnamensis DSM 17526]
MKHIFPKKPWKWTTLDHKVQMQWKVPLSIMYAVIILLSIHVPQAVLAQTAEISGTVISGEDQQPIPGATVLVKGSGTGTVTDLDGNFTVKVNEPATAVLSISFVGYVTQEISVNNQSTIQVELDPDVSQLDEVVVVGYGETKRKDLTGSVVSMDSKNIQEANKVNAFQALQGQVAGVNIQAADNKPGGGFNVRIRGSNTINANETVEQGGFNPGQNPLFVVDGIFVNDISFLNPADIERMDVLKDASATAIYGSRGSNGVVIIETKKGSEGKMTVQYDNYIGVKEAYNLPDMLQGEEFVQYFRDAVVGNFYASGDFSVNAGDVNLSDYMRPNELENVANGDYVNWIDLIQHNGMQQNHTLSLNGGNDKTVYGIGVAYTQDEGTFEGEDYERYTIRGNLSSKLSDLFSVAFNNYASFAIRNEGSREGLRSAYRLRPTGTPFDENGDPQFFPLQGETFITNPLFEPDNITRETRTLNYLSNLSLSFTPVENLKISSNFSPNIEFSRYGEYRGRYAKSTSGQQGNTRAEVNNRNRISYTWDNIVNYNLEFGSDHRLNTTFVYSLFMDRYENYLMQRRNYGTDEFLFYNIDAGSDLRTADGGFSKQTLESYTARVNYAFKDKYLLTLTGRYDGSSILAEQNKWAFFPSAAFAWRIIDEGFMQDQNFIADLKLRLSYGETGNNGTGGGLVPLGSLSLIGNNFTNIGDQVTQTAYVTNLANQDLTWEKTKEFNFGLDFGFFNNRLYGSLDIYHRKNTGIIFFRPISTVSGFSGVFQNVGEAENKGIELGLNSVNIHTGDFKWTTSLNFAKNNNKITKLYGDLDQILFGVQAGSYVHKVGEPVGSIYSYVFDGIWQLDEADEAQSYGQQPGQVRVRDLNDDGSIDADDRTVIGSNMPKWSGGIANTFNYKNWDFTFFVRTNQGAVSASYFHISHSGGFDSTPARFNSLQTNYWTPDNPSNEWFQPSNNGPFSEPLTYHDVSFVKVGYITLGYNFKQPVLDALKIQNLRLYFTAQNPFTFTNYEGWDPENAARNSWGSAYMSRIFMGGINVKF